MPYTDTGDVLASYGLPDLPEPAGEEGDEGTARLVLSRFQQPKIRLGGGFSVADAQAYCSREDTHSAGEWFVCYYAD